jgi:hypothetical protein
MGSAVWCLQGQLVALLSILEVLELQAAQWRIARQHQDVSRAEENQLLADTCAQPALTERCPSPMHGQAGEVIRAQPSVCQCRPQHLLLCWTVGCCKAAAAAILVDGSTSNDCQQLCTLLCAGTCALQQHHPHCLCPDVAVSCRIKGLAAALRGQHACSRRQYVDTCMNVSLLTTTQLF